MRRVIEIFFDEFRDVQLIADFEGFLGIGRRLIEVGLGDGLDVRDLVGFLIFLKVGLYASEFSFDDYKPFVDELSGVFGGLVLVVNPLLIVDVNKGIEDVGRPLRESVGHGQGDYRRLLVGQRDTQALKEVLGSGGSLKPVDSYLRLPFRIVNCRKEDYIADRGGDGVAQSSLHLGLSHLLGLGTAHFLVTDGEARQDEGTVRLRDSDE